MGTFLFTLDSLISQLLTFQPFVQAVLDSQLGKLQNRFNFKPFNNYDVRDRVISLT